MLPVTHGARSTRNHILAYTVLLAPLGFAPVLTGLGGAIYAVTSIALGAGFLWLAFGVWRSNAGDAGAPGSDLKKAKGLFAFSILYLFVLFAALIVEHGAGLYFAIPGLS